MTWQNTMLIDEPKRWQRMWVASFRCTVCKTAVVPSDPAWCAFLINVWFQCSLLFVQGSDQRNKTKQLQIKPQVLEQSVFVCGRMKNCEAWKSTATPLLLHDEYWMLPTPAKCWSCFMWFRMFLVEYKRMRQNCTIVSWSRLFDSRNCAASDLNV